jgi:hypothetical protein
METARALTENLAALLRREHRALAEFLVALADFDQRRRWVELGHSSLFYFLHRELRLSKGAAQYRKVAAELIQEVPGVVEPLRQGQLCLTSIIEAAKVVTADNWEAVLPRFYGLSKREAMEVVAALQPHPAPPTRSVVTAVRPATAMQSVALVPAALDLGEAREPPGPLRDSDPAEPEPVARGWPDELAVPAVPQVAVAAPFEVAPLTAEQSRLHATVSGRFLRKLEAARDALSHARPDATPGEILEAGLDLLLAQAEKRKGMVEKPREKARPSKDDHIPAQVRREVWKRDGGRCQWALASGGICGSTRHLELDHIRPRSRGGASTAANLRILCKGHNDLAARLALGNGLMDQFTFGLRGTRGSTLATRAKERERPPASST